ncbi:TPA: hypothetical protein QCV86_003020 [Bacillus thuringiensis]|nr:MULTISPECIES: hypothetical protein [Bacillus cereus group]KLA37181.1 hypothetical protein B4158_5683 [Bacillus cereus]MBG9674732.1 hypothetical protein [Bacillus thuringiensis]MBU0451090.1 hypothetical protein [Bacillus thuringiensis]MCC3982927.1 hypothetical protein [Bacillus thuringiensis serovar kurstaki]MCR6840994.1 hypothetical protein [Bacillus thuringiensis]
MGSIKYLYDVNGESKEIKPTSNICTSPEPENADKGVTMKEMCELISKWLKEAYKIEVSPKQIFNYSPSGELAEVFFMYWQAKAYFDGEEGEICNVTFL